MVLREMKVSPEDVRTPWTHGAGSAPARRRVSWRAGRCRGAPGPTELSAPRPVALATTSAQPSVKVSRRSVRVSVAEDGGKGAPSASLGLLLGLLPAVVGLRWSRHLCGAPWDRPGCRSSIAGQVLRATPAAPRHRDCAFGALFLLECWRGCWSGELRT